MSATAAKVSSDDPIKTPHDLVTALQRSGKFDELRKALWRDFEQSPDKEDFLARIETIVQASLERPSFKQKPRKARQAELMIEVETRHTHLSKLLSETERSVKMKEREREGEGKRGPIKSDLYRILKENRGEKVEDSESEEELEDEASKSNSITPIPIPSTSNPISSLPPPPGPLLPTPPHLPPQTSSSKTQSTSTSEVTPPPPIPEDVKRAETPPEIMRGVIEEKVEEVVAIEEKVEEVVAEEKVVPEDVEMKVDT